MICSYWFYEFTQAVTAACGWERRPVDDAIDEAVAAIEDFILANSSSHPTRRMLEDERRRNAERLRASLAGQPQFCEDRRMEIFRSVRVVSPEQTRESVKDLLSIPREPVANPCL